MTETTVDRRTAAASPTCPAGPVALALLDLVDSLLAAGPERTHVLSAALELAVLRPAGTDLAAVRAEVEADRDSTVRALSAVPLQRGSAEARTALLASVDLIRDRRLEAVDLATGLLAD